MPIVRWFIVSSCSLFIITILLLPGKNNERYDPSLSSFIDSFFSLSIGLWGMFEAVIHVFMFATLVFLWQWTLVLYSNRRKSLLFAVLIAVLLATGTEFAQYFVSRSSLLIDLIANFLGITLVAFTISYRHRNSDD